MDEDDRPAKRKGMAQPVLDGFSLDDLQDYIRQLHAEIARAEAAIAARGRHRSQADSFFRQG